MAEIDRYLKLCIEKRASDLHFSSGEPVRVRIDGDLETLEPHPLDENILQRILFEILTEAERKRFLASKNLDKSYALESKAYFRVNIFLTRRGLAAVLRTIPNKIPTLADLGLPDVIRQLSELSKGLVLVTGPTGSGKSTTLAAMLNYINNNFPYHILTAEDPVEFVHSSKKSLVNQREIGSNCPSFADALKYALREDPDVILVGEMRDLETIGLALTAAETGHLVFGTLHTRGAGASVDRIIDSFPANQQAMIRTMLSESLAAVISQALLKKSDHTGRVAAYEILVVNHAISNLIREGKSFQIASAMQTGRKEGMILMDQHILELVDSGTVTPEEAESYMEDSTPLKIRKGKVIIKPRESLPNNKTIKGSEAQTTPVEAISFRTPPIKPQTLAVKPSSIPPSIKAMPEISIASQKQAVTGSVTRSLSAMPKAPHLRQSKSLSSLLEKPPASKEEPIENLRVDPDETSENSLDEQHEQESAVDSDVSRQEEAPQHSTDESFYNEQISDNPNAMQENEPGLDTQEENAYESEVFENSANSARVSEYASDATSDSELSGLSNNSKSVHTDSESASFQEASSQNSDPFQENMDDQDFMKSVPEEEKSQPEIQEEEPDVAVSEINEDLAADQKNEISAISEEKQTASALTPKLSNIPKLPNPSESPSWLSPSSSYPQSSRPASSNMGSKTPAPAPHPPSPPLTTSGTAAPKPTDKSVVIKTLVNKAKPMASPPKPNRESAPLTDLKKTVNAHPPPPKKKIA